MHYFIIQILIKFSFYQITEEEEEDEEPEEMTISFGHTRKGHRMLICDDFIFHKESVTRKGSLWKCASSHKFKCRARAKITNVDGVEVVKLTHAKHSHPFVDYKLD